jgi:FkbM family methyltransferase
MLLSEAAHSISYDGHEPEARAWISANVKPGFVCLDVGAHLGVFTLLMGELAGPSGAVHAFEPFSASVDMTRRTLDENRLSDRVKLVQAAVDEEDGGNVRLFVSESSPSEASLHDGETRPGSVDVPRVSLDAYVQREGLEQVDVIKMDIEGTEERALRGARQILEHMTPRLLVEIHGRQNIGALDLLVSLGYSVTTVSGAPISSATFPEAGVHVVATHGT